ncbi:MAG: hypothetical protein ACREOZ_03100, partial [Gloeomargaritales cyanobacterium]
TYSLRSSYYDKHVIKFHPDSRELTNSQLAAITISKDPETSPQWAAQLSWLSAMEFQPMPFRKSFYKNLRALQRKSVHDLLQDVFQSFLASHSPVSEDLEPPPHESSTTPFYHLTALFEALLMGPRGNNETRGKLGHLLDARLHAFRSGNIRELYERAISIKSIPPGDPSRPSSLDKAVATAIALANDDNLGKAFRQISSDTPVAPNTPPVVEALGRLYPPPCPYEPRARSQRQAGSAASTAELFTSADPFITNQLYNKDNIRTYLRSQKRGSAPGLLADSTDLFIDFFLSRTDDTSHEDSANNVTFFASLIEKIMRNQLPNETRDSFCSSRLIALQKDRNNPLKLRPIAIGSALRRLTSGWISRVHRPYIAEKLAPFQFGIGVPGGLDFVALSTSLRVDKYVARSIDEVKTKPPTRTLVLLDLENMFNSVSRKCSRDQLLETFPHLVRYFDLLHEQASKCWYLNPDGLWEWLLQVEGLPQGCPLSGLFACLGLNHILLKLDTELSLRAASRLDAGDIGDDGKGSITDIFAILDDTNATIHYDDLLFFFQRFAELGAPLGCRLSPQNARY